MASSVTPGRRWAVSRGTSPADLAVRAVVEPAPHDDVMDPEPAVLGDGRTLYYRVEETTRLTTRLRVDKLPSRGSVRLSWRDFQPGVGPAIDLAASRLVAEAGCHGLGDLAVPVRALVVDEAGDPAGIVEGLSLDPADVAPAVVVGWPQSTPDGTSYTLRSPEPADILPVLDFETGRLAATEPLRFEATAPRAGIFADPEVQVGLSAWFYADAFGGVEPYEFEWDLTGDGQVDSTEDYAVIRYETPGPRVVRLVLRDANGCVDAAVHHFEVVP